MEKKKRYVKTRASEVDLVGKPLTDWIGSEGGIATLGSDGKLEASQCPESLDNSTHVLYTTTGSANSYQITAPDVELKEGLKLFVKFHTANTSSTVNINFNGGGNIRLYAYGTTGPLAYNIYTNNVREIVYSGGIWMLADYQYFTNRSTLSDCNTYGSDAQFGSYRGVNAIHPNHYILLCSLKINYNATYFVAHSGVWEMKCIETTRLADSNANNLENLTVKVRAQLNPAGSGGTLFNAAVPDLKVTVSGDLKESKPDDVVAFVSAGSTSTKTISVYKRVTRYGQIYNVIPVNHRIQSFSAGVSSNAYTSFTAASVSLVPASALPAAVQGNQCRGVPEGRLEIASYEELDTLTTPDAVEFLNKGTGDNGHLIVTANPDQTGIQYLLTGNGTYRRSGRWNQDGTNAYWEDWYPLAQTDYSLDINITPKRWLNQQPVYERVIKIAAVDHGRPAQVMIGHEIRIIDVKGSYVRNGLQYPITTTYFPGTSPQASLLISYDPSNGWMQLDAQYLSVSDVYLVLEYTRGGNAYYHENYGDPSLEGAIVLKYEGFECRDGTLFQPYFNSTTEVFLALKANSDKGYQSSVYVLMDGVLYKARHEDKGNMKHWVTVTLPGLGEKIYEFYDESILNVIQ